MQIWHQRLFPRLTCWISKLSPGIKIWHGVITQTSRDRILLGYPASPVKTARTPPHSNTFLSCTTGHSTQKSISGRTTEIVRAVFADNFALSAHNRKWTDRNSSGLHSQATETEQCAPTAAVTTAAGARKIAQNAQISDIHNDLCS